MLTLHPTLQHEGEHRRQWFTDDYFDLYVWYHSDNTIFGFQLCYDKTGDQRAFTWLSTGDFRHERVDPGESSPLASRSPTITHACPFDPWPVRYEFDLRSSQLDPTLHALILERLDAFPTKA